MLLKKITSFILIIILSFFFKLSDFVVFAISPSDISNQVFFLDGQDIDADGDNSNEPSDGSKLSNLIDKFNSNSGSQIDLNKQPIYNINSINSFPSITFDGTGDLLNIKDNIEISNGTGFYEKSYSMIIKTGEDITTFQTIYDEGTKEKGFAFQIENEHIYAGTYNTIDWSDPNKFKVIDLGLITKNTTYTIIFVYDKINDSVKGYLDGILINTLNDISLQTTHGACTFETSFACTIYNTGGTIGLGSTKNDTLKLSDNSQIIGFESNYFLGNIGEISSYNHALTTNEVNGLHDYLKTKWGLNPSVGKIFHFDAQNTDGDFDNSNEPNNNNSLETWVDINTGYNASQTSTGNQATYLTNSINNHPSITFDGTDDYYEISNQTDINTADNYSEKSFSMIMKTSSDINTFQVLYEQGGGTRGYAIQIENGHMYMGAWNNSERDSPDQYKFIDLGNVTADTIYNILIIQNSTNGTDATNTIKAYLNSNLVGILDTVDIQIKHGGDINIAMNSGSRKYDGSAPGDGHYFNGNIGEFISWNHVLTDTEIGNLDDYLIDRWDLDYISPIISSSNIIDNQILPGGNHSIELNYTDNTGGSGIDTSSASITLEKWDGNSWIIDTNISENSVTTTQTTYLTNDLSFGKYRATFNISDNKGNISENYIITFYIDNPKLIISNGNINIGALNNISNSFGDTITITVKTIGAGFNVKLKNNDNLKLNSGEIIPYYDGIIGMGYDKNNDGNLTDYNNKIIMQETQNINTNGELNTYTYTLKIGAIISIQQASGNYSGKMNFGIELDY